MLIPLNPFRLVIISRRGISVTDCLHLGRCVSVNFASRDDDRNGTTTGLTVHYKIIKKYITNWHMKTDTVEPLASDFPRVQEKWSLTRGGRLRE